MRCFCHAWVASIVVAGSATLASAADLPTKAPVYKAPAPVAVPYNWSGFYIGANAGAHWLRDDDPAYVSANNNFVPSALALINSAVPNTLTKTGFAAGLHAGYNWQTSNIVVGLEADFDGLSGSAQRNVDAGILCGLPCSPVTDSARDRWMGTLRPRIGIAADRLLLFVTGGAAWSNWTTNHSATYFGGATVTGVDNTSTTRSGWTAGGGLEYALTANWVGRVEYLYANFGTMTTSYNMTAAGFPGFFTTITEREKLSENIVRVGISYQFH